MAEYRPDAAVEGADLPDPDAPPADPAELLPAWLPGNDDPSRPLMTLATVDDDGYPDTRTVLLSEYGERGFFFHTDAGSRKVAQLSSEPRVALTMVWPERLRQLVVQGVALPTTAEETAAVYARRPRYLQLLAWLNTAEYARMNLEERVWRWSHFDDTHPAGTLTAPDGWVGFVVQPSRYTFWQGRPDRASIRVEYRASAEGWTVSRLPG